MWAQCRGTMWQQQHNVGAQSICGGIINLWGLGMPCPHHPPPCYHATMPCPHHMPCPYRSTKPGQWVPL